MRSYIRVDPELADRKKRAAYPDGAFAAFVELLCAAEHQPHRGRFATLAILRAYLSRRARWIPFLLDHDDLEALIDGSYYVIGWDEWQEGDWKVQERVQRIRNRRRGKELTARVTVDVTPHVTVATVNTPSERLADSGKHLAIAVSKPPPRGYRGGDMTKLADDLPKLVAK